MISCLTFKPTQTRSPTSPKSLKNEMKTVTVFACQQNNLQGGKEAPYVPHVHKLENFVKR